MREAILVAVNNDGNNRLSEYLPDGDTIVIGGVTYPGEASQYLQFLLDNVLPTLDFNYRTLGDAANTLVAGSSMGGLVSDYIAFARSDRFGAAGIFSPAYWAAPTYLGERTMTRLPVRRYVYMGTAESSSGAANSDTYWQGALNVYNAFMEAGHAAHSEIRFEGGAGAAHNEPAWSARLPAFFGYALDPWREANPLALQHFPPQLGIESAGSGLAFDWTVPVGFEQRLQVTPALGSGWNAAGTGTYASVTAFWDRVTTPVPAEAAARSFWRLEVPQP
jgi:predicted alpha/beta superfamily hydrolase